MNLLQQLLILTESKMTNITKDVKWKSVKDDMDDRDLFEPEAFVIYTEISKILKVKSEMLQYATTDDLDDAGEDLIEKIKAQKIISRGRMKSGFKASYDVRTIDDAKMVVVWEEGGGVTLYRSK